jgi:hypothetical protein
MIPMPQKNDLELAYQKFDLVLKKFSTAGAQEIFIKMIMQTEKDFIDYYKHCDKKQYYKIMGQA